MFMVGVGVGVSGVTMIGVEVGGMGVLVSTVLVIVGVITAVCVEVGVAVFVGVTAAGHVGQAGHVTPVSVSVGSKCESPSFVNVMQELNNNKRSRKMGIFFSIKTSNHS